jgi:gamma-glutamyltranspeptidase / glutathione hydrolase
MSFFRPSFLYLIPIIFACTVPTEKNTLEFDNAAVGSAHPLASEVGAGILKKGGNAFDAAIATHFALAACFPNAGNLGGGGFCLSRDRNGNYRFLDFRETAPQKASKNMFLDSSGNVIQGQSTQGALAIGVPGTVDGLWRLHQEYGSILWKDLVQPAMEIAKGYVLSSREAYLANKYNRSLKEENDSSFFLIRDDREWQVGDSIFNPNLSRSLMQIRDSGRIGFYEGTLMKTLVEGIKAKGGILEEDDFKNYRSLWRDPIQFEYKDYNVISAPLPSSGGIGLLGILSMLEDLPLNEWGHYSAKTIHRVVEAERLFYHQRAMELGDPDFLPSPSFLYSKKYFKELAKKISPKAIKSSSLARTEKSASESEETTHISIIDSMGNAVSMSITLNGAYGSKFCVPGTGFFMNNEMDDFSVSPGTPNDYGLIGGKANSIAPGKRMLSSMTPTIIEKDNEVLLVLGSPGGATIITTVLQVILNVIEFDFSLKEAVDLPRYHHQWLPDSIQMEESFLSFEDSMDLVERGHHFKWRGIIGRVNALKKENGKITAGPDRRWDNTARGF